MLIKYCLLCCVSVLLTVTASTQILKRLDTETAEAFIQRIKGDTMVLAHPVIETNVWDSTVKTIIAFYGYDDPSDVNIGLNKIFGYLFVPTGQNNYRTIRFGPIEEDGGYPEIISVFFANADKDSKKELIVLCKYEQRHYDYSGAFYETFIFDHPSGSSQLTYFHQLSEKFWGCECGWRNGKKETAKYKTAGAIRTGLLKMGF